MPPESTISLTTCSQASIFLDDTIIFAPSSEYLNAIPFPIPLEEPVMIATLFFKSKKMLQEIK